MVDYTKFIGDFGRWQFFVFFICAASGLSSSMQIYVMTFFTPNLDYWCSRPDSLKDEVSVQEWRNYSSPMVTVEGKIKRSSCKEYDVDFDHMNVSELMHISHKETKHCHTWEFDKGIFKKTMIEEFNLVCSRDILISNCNAVFMAVFMVSVLVMGHLADRFGRRSILIISAAFVVIFSIAMAFSTSFMMFLILRAFQGFFELPIGAVAFTMFLNDEINFFIVAETCSEKHRAVLGNLTFYGFSLGTILLTGVSYALRNWVHIQYVIVALSSPIWLIAKERYHEAALEIQKAMRWNRLEAIDVAVIEKDIKDRHKADKVINKFQLHIFSYSNQQWKVLILELIAVDTRESIKEVHYSFLDLLKRPALRYKTLNLFLCWPVNAFVYYGLSFNTNDLGGNPFIDFLISASVEIPAYIIGAFMTKYIGRRLSVMGMMVVAGLACASTIIIPKDMLTLQILFPMIGKLCISASFTMLYIYSTELFPTVVRSIGLGSCSMIGRVGSILAPYVRQLGRDTHFYVPPAIYGSLSVASGLLILFLPETKGEIIPDHLEEAEQHKRSVSKKFLETAQKKGKEIEAEAHL
ncbi:Organic cation transporter protein [Nymphon striatum]|nr:Organic cation transporter protein [Nymphon striatum]